MIKRKNKKGWIRVLEMTIAVLIITGVMVVVYSKNSGRALGPEDYIYNLQKKVLADFSGDEGLRFNVLNANKTGSVEELDNYTRLNNYADSRIPGPYNHSLVICNLGEVCNLENDVFIYTLDKEVYVEETVISATLDKYDPKKVRIFVWVER